MRGRRPQAPHHVIKKLFISVPTLAEGPQPAQSAGKLKYKIRRGAEGPKHHIILFKNFFISVPILAEGPQPVQSTGKLNACGKNGRTLQLGSDL